MVRKLILNSVRNVTVLPSRKMDSCDENKDINARIVDMSFRIRLVLVKRRLKYNLNNFGKTTLPISKPIENSVRNII